MLAHEDLQSIRLLVLANKQDVKGCMTAAEISQQLQLTELKKHTWNIQSCCALTGEGLSEGLEWMTQQVHVRYNESILISLSLFQFQVIKI